MVDGKSDQLTVLRGRENRLHGEGADGNTQPAQETGAGHAGSDNTCKPHCRQ